MNNPLESNFRTVVFQVTDQDKFKQIWSDFCQQMADDSEVNGCLVTGLSFGDVFEEVEKLEEKLLEESWR